LYRARLVEGTYDGVEMLPKPLNGPSTGDDAFMAPDESFMILTAWRDDGLGGADLYISFHVDNDTWTPPRNMGEEVNSAFNDSSAMLSPCGEYLFFTSRRARRLRGGSPLTYEAIQRAWQGPQNSDKLGDLYWIDATIIDSLRARRP